MKYLAVLAALVCLAAQANPPQPRHPPANLRQVLQDYDRGSPAEPRQLTATERAELRRQLSESQTQSQAQVPAPRRR